jgi:anthranilate synthase/aminodeoxychorismate synthase-like glutamine amidotransferase
LILVLDNRDSFTFNLVQALQSLGGQVHVGRAQEMSLGDVMGLGPDRILIGPGPGRPEDASLSLEILEQLAGSLPILGVCLGMQAMATAWGGSVGRAGKLVHGWTVPVIHDGRGVFDGLTSPLEMARYNSLAVVEGNLPSCLEISARDPEGEILGLRHRVHAVEGVQFHPESILSKGGIDLLRNFIELSG